MPKDFFEEVDSTGIVESHIQQVLKLEHDEAESILSDYADIRKEMVDRLSKMPRGSFSAQHLRGTLAQVEGAITALNKSLAGESKKSAYKAALLGVRGLTDQIKVFDEKFSGAVTPINLNAELIAHDTSNLLATKYNTNLDQYGNGLFQQISNGLFSAVTGETTMDEVIGRISGFFNGEEWKLHRIVRTELHNVVNIGKQNGMEELMDDIPDLMKTLMHPMDIRTGADSKKAANEKLVANVDEPFQYIWDGKIRTFMAPPDRPNDRSIMVPYRKEWGKTRHAAFIPGTFPEA